LNKPVIQYHYRGGIERGPNYDWRDGYSQGDTATIYYPWMTKRECQKDAARQECEAVFIRDGKEETA